MVLVLSSYKMFCSNVFRLATRCVWGSRLPITGSENIVPVVKRERGADIELTSDEETYVGSTSSDVAYAEQSTENISEMDKEIDEVDIINNEDADVDLLNKYLQNTSDFDEEKRNFSEACTCEHKEPLS